jgi:sec-independent protein translocase protein TatA
MLGEIIGPDLIIIALIVLVLFGSSQLPKLARSLGTAKREFEKGLGGSHAADDTADTRPEVKSDTKPDA